MGERPYWAAAGSADTFQGNHEEPSRYRIFGSPHGPGMAQWIGILGTLLLLRHGGPAGALHDAPASEPRPYRACRRHGAVPEFHGDAVRAGQRSGVGLAHHRL